MAMVEYVGIPSERLADSLGSNEKMEIRGLFGWLDGLRGQRLGDSELNSALLLFFEQSSRKEASRSINYRLALGGIAAGAAIGEWVPRKVASSMIDLLGEYESTYLITFWGRLQQDRLVTDDDIDDTEFADMATSRMEEMYDYMNSVGVTPAKRRRMELLGALSVIGMPHDPALRQILDERLGLELLKPNVDLVPQH
jgi:hypothetical protein